jgi:membrane protease YdiL (CAAX protease family)
MERKRQILTFVAFAIGAAYFAIRVFYLGANFVFDPSKVLVFLIIAPIGEELLFRGVIQEYLEQRKLPSFYIVSLANLIASILFVFLHFLVSEPLQASLVFIPSLIFGIMYSEYRSVWITILLHSFYNLNVMFV